MYTLDSSKTESPAAPQPAYAPPSAPPPAQAPVPVVPSQYIPPNYQYYPYQYPQAPVVPPVTRKVSDWLAWSIVNLFIGGLLGIIPLIFSLVCRSKKRKNDLGGARKMSTLALVFNIIITILGVAATIGLLIYYYISYTKRTQVYY